MKFFLLGLLSFIKGTIHYRILHPGPGEFSKDADIIPIHSYRFAAIHSRRRWGMEHKMMPGKLVSFATSLPPASAN